MRRADELRGLRERWAAVDEPVLRSVRERLTAADPAIRSPFGDVDGRVDLRGLVATPDPAQGRVAVGEGRSSRWTGLDLTGADLREMSWTDHRVEDCVLDDADLTNLRCWGVHVARSRLRRAGLHHAQLGAGPASRFPPSVWCDVDLTSANLRASTAAHATLERAELGSARLAGAHWTSLVDCRFAGLVDGLTLGGSVVGEDAGGVRLQGVDLSRARIRRLRLVGVDLGHPSVEIALPEDDGHWVVPSWPAFLTRVRAAMRGPTGAADDDLAIVATVWAERADADRGSRQTIGFISRRDLVDLGGEGLAELLAGMRDGSSDVR